MATLFFGMMQSLDGYVDGPESDLALPPPGPALFRHFIEQTRAASGVLYGSRIYELMRYWDEDRQEWDAPEHEYAAAWRAHPKWVASNTLKSVGPNASLIEGDLEEFVRNLKAKVEGEIGVAGPSLAGSLTRLGLIDKYQLYFRPFVLGSGKPFFAGARPPLRLVANEPIDDDTVRLTYVPLQESPST